MGKNKLRQFADIKSFKNVVEPELNEILNKDYSLKGKWSSDFFGNNKPLILELGCGKGEYTLALARQDYNINFIGIDIKGARIWRGAKTALENDLLNVGFLRTRVEFIKSFFDKNEVSEIWITFPDPQPGDRRIKKRLTCPDFLAKYQNFLKPEGVIHLKTDSRELYDYTVEVCEEINAHIHYANTDIYSEDELDPILYEKTFYEKQFLKIEKKINYLKFSLPEVPFIK